MSEITFKYDEKDVISAFAFNTGKLVEKLIAQETNNLQGRLSLLEAHVLGFYQLLDGDIKREYARYFNISEIREGRI